MCLDNNMESIILKNKGAVWYHTDDYHSPNLSKASLGEFFCTILTEGAQIGDVWCFNKTFPRSSVYVSVFMTEEMKNNIEQKTKFKFKLPSKIHLN